MILFRFSVLKAKESPVFLSAASNGTRQDSGRLPDRLQELPEQHGEEAGPTGDGEPLLRTQDGTG